MCKLAGFANRRPEGKVGQRGDQKAGDRSQRQRRRERERKDASYWELKDDDYNNDDRGTWEQL